MKNFILSICILSAGISYAQVGIETSDPEAMLDVNGDIIIRDVPEEENLNEGLRILVLDNSAGDAENPYATNQVRNVSLSQLTTATNQSFNGFAAFAEGDWTLIEVNIGDNDWYKLPISSTHVHTGDSTLLNQGTFTASESGIYAVNLEVQLDAGLALTLLGANAIGILKTDDTTPVVQKSFAGVTIVLGGSRTATVPLTSTSLSTLVELEAGESLDFIFYDDSPIAINLLQNTVVSAHVYKVN